MGYTPLETVPTWALTAILLVCVVVVLIAKPGSDWVGFVVGPATILDLVILYRVRARQRRAAHHAAGGA